jgi:hypothetical protein
MWDTVALPNIDLADVSGVFLLYYLVGLVFELSA